MGRDKKIGNAMKRSEQHRKARREKEQEKLKRRMAIKKAEQEKGVGEERKRERLAKNVPNTLDNTRIYDASSYLTADPKQLQAAAERAAEASRRANDKEEAEEANGDESEEEGSEEGDSDEEDEEMPEAGPSSPRQAQPAEVEEEEEDEPQPPAPTGPPRILITTSPSICKETYAFCDDLKNVFPGGEFFKRPKGRGFEMGRVARWAAKRGYHALIVVNEDHKKPNAITLMTLPAGPTAYFKLTSVQLSSQIYGHARSTPHSPELILNNFTTLLGNSVGRVFGSLFPPQPQFRGRQVVTLHNQRDFLFFRRHRYAFASANKAKLQEIGPRFTLKLRWLRKGLPAVTAADGSVPRGGDAEDEDVDEEEIARQEKADEDEAMAEMGKGVKPPQPKKRKGGDPDLGIPALDEEQEYEWKWKPKMEVSRRTFFL